MKRTMTIKIIVQSRMVLTVKLIAEKKESIRSWVRTIPDRPCSEQAKIVIELFLIEHK